MTRTPTFGRYAEIPYDEMTAEQQEAYRSLIENRGRLPGPTKIWVENAKLAKLLAPLGAYLQPAGFSLSLREREIAVVLVTGKWHSAYPLAAHERHGKEAGLPAETVDALVAGLPVSFSDPREQIVYETASALLGARWIGEGLYRRALALLGHDGVSDVIVLMGYYTAASFTLAFYDVAAGAPGLAP